MCSHALFILIWFSAFRGVEYASDRQIALYYRKPGYFISQNLLLLCRGLFEDRIMLQLTSAKISREISVWLLDPSPLKFISLAEGPQCVTQLYTCWNWNDSWKCQQCNARLITWLAFVLRWVKVVAKIAAHVLRPIISRQTRTNFVRQ